MGESLNDLGYEQMTNLIEDIDNSLRLIRERKTLSYLEGLKEGISLCPLEIEKACNLRYKVIGNQIETSKKKLRNVEEIHRKLVLEFDARHEDPQYGLVENEAGDYNSVLGFPNGGPRIIALRLPPPPPPNHHHATFHHGGGSAVTDLTMFPLLE